MRVCKTLIDLSLTPNSCFLPHQTAAQGGGRRPPPSSPRASPPFTLFVSFAGVQGCSGVRSGIVTSGRRLSDRLWDRRHTTGSRQFGCFVLGCWGVSPAAFGPASSRSRIPTFSGCCSALGLLRPLSQLLFRLLCFWLALVASAIVRAVHLLGESVAA